MEVLSAVYSAKVSAMPGFLAADEEDAVVNVL